MHNRRKEAVAKLLLTKLANVLRDICRTAWKTITSSQILASGNNSKRCQPDFSDIAHLTISFKGICLQNEQMILVKDALERWCKKMHSTPGEMVHLYIRKKYPSMKEAFEKYHELTEIYQRTVTNIIDMAVESVDSLDDSLGPLLVSYAEDSGIFKERACFDRYYWRKVCEALCELPHQFPRNLKRRREIILTWRIIILFLFCKIEYALEFQLRRTQNPYSFDNPCYVCDNGTERREIKDSVAYFKLEI